MEQEKFQKEKEVQRAIQDLHQSVVENLKKGEYYGLDQKIKNLQRAFAITSRI